METVNESSLSSAYLSPIVTWVRQQFKLKSPTILHVSKSSKAGIDGWTGRSAPDRPILVKLGVKRRKFPYVTTHAGIETKLHSFEEEIVLVLAHELRHAYQMEAGLFGGMQGHWAELDAERFAVKVLDRWRKA